MGFKWFKARMRMNRMPAHSSAVVGTYRTITISASNNDYVSNNNPGDYGRAEVEPRSKDRPISMPNFGNPNAKIANENDGGEFARLSNTEIGQSSSTRSLEYAGENMYKGLGVGEPLPMKHQILDKDLSENIAKRTPRPVQKMKNSDYKRKKGKAPAPRINLSSGTSGNGGKEFSALQTKSDTEV